ncbi:MAG: radical SAM protein [Chloroflexi bacterium]|nr:radical SAM protein [Chloroflexota bacterium]
MKVLLLNPPFIGRFSRTSRSPGVSRSGTLYYPFWLIYTAGVLDQNGLEVSFIDAPAEGLATSEVIARAKESPPQLIVIDTSTPSIYNDIKVAEQLKENFPASFITLVGTHPSALPHETLQLSDQVDAVARGEYDYTIRDLAAGLSNGSDLSAVDGLVFRQNGEIVENRPRALIENLDELPFISRAYRKFLETRNYFFAASDYPMVMVITGRGCPYKCFFCVYPQTFHSRQYRPRSPKNVVDEFEYISQNMPEVREIGIEDDTFTVDQARAREICRLIIERNLRVKWYCNVRVNLEPETMRWMKQAGCHLVTVGFESANQAILNKMHKGITVEQIKEFVSNARNAGLLVHGCFMAGNPGETRETLAETLKLAKELNCDTMQFYPLLVYPGTEAYQWAKENDYLTTDDFRQWATEEATFNCVLNLPGLSTDDINAFCARANREYYLRPRYMLMKLKQVILHPNEIRRTLKGARAYFGMLRKGL